MLQAMKIKVSELSSQLKRGKRGKILNQFKNDKIDILVATDALARGIDIGKIDFVISYDCPKFVKTYIHRVGRTARAGQSGRAITLIENNQMKAFKIMFKQYLAHVIKQPNFRIPNPQYFVYLLDQTVGRDILQFIY